MDARNAISENFPKKECTTQYVFGKGHGNALTFPMHNSIIFLTKFKHIYVFTDNISIHIDHNTQLKKVYEALSKKFPHFFTLSIFI